MLVIAVSLVRARVLVVVIVQVVHDDVHRDRRAEEREDEEGEETKGRARHYELVGASRETRKYIPMNDKRERRFDTPPVLPANHQSPHLPRLSGPANKRSRVRWRNRDQDDRGVPIPVGRKELLIETQQTVRPTDAADVQLVRLRIAAEGGGCNPPSHASTGTLAAR